MALILILPASIWGQIQTRAGQVDSLLVSTILFDVLDTITVKLDSSAFQRPYPTLPKHLRPLPYHRALSSGYTLQPASAYFKGSLDAIADLRKPHLSIKTSGLARILTLADGTSWQVEPVLTWIMSTMYSVDLEAVAGDLVDPWILAYIKGYNQISESVINRYFGCDVMKSAFDEISATIQEVGTSHPEWRATL